MMNDDEIWRKLFWASLAFFRQGFWTNSKNDKLVTRLLLPEKNPVALHFNPRQVDLRQCFNVYEVVQLHLSRHTSKSKIRF